MTYCVYKHTFPNGKVYIGITSLKPDRRWNKGNGYNHNKFMSRAIKKYGWENIKHEILYTSLTQQEAEEKEKELILKYNSVDRRKGYNLDYGGNYAGKHSAQTKLKLKKHNNPNSKKVIQCDLNNRIIKKYKSTREAERQTGIVHQNISLCCRKIKYNTCGGFIWYFEDDFKKVLKR